MENLIFWKIVGESMYQALYRQYRPKVFDDVLGQDHIISSLKNQINKGNIGHAYLFSGTRGGTCHNSDRVHKCFSIKGFGNFY